MGTTEEAPRRKDALRNREAILVAARELFADCGDVPMCEVARRAGVGQATLYRNFPDHRSLAAALLTEQVDGLERLAAEYAGDPDAFFVLMRSLVEAIVRFDALGQLAREGACAGSALDVCRRRLAELMKDPLRVAKAAGAVRRDLTIDDVFLVLSMVRGATEGAPGPAARAAAASRVLALALDGLAPAGVPA